MNDHHSYRSIIGGLLYLSFSKRPDLMCTISVLAPHLNTHTARHMKLVQRVLRHLNETLHHGLHHSDKLSISGKSNGASVDTSWGGCTAKELSNNGFMITMNGSPIYWKSNRQMVIDSSSGESEYVALTPCGKELSWTRTLFRKYVMRSQWMTTKNYFPQISTLTAPPVCQLQF